MNTIAILVSLILVVQASVPQKISVNAGIAMSIENKLMSSSKNALINYIERSLFEVHLDDIHVLNTKFHGLRFKSVHILEQDIFLRIGGPNNDRIKVDIYKMGGELSGTSSTR